MTKNIEDLKREYRNVAFRLESPILDIGGGDGSFLKSQRIKKALIMDAIVNKSKDYDYINVDLTKRLPDLNKKFKTIFIMEVLKHLKNPLYLLSQVYDLLDDSGKCYVAIPYTKIGENVQHVCRWRLKEIREQLKKLGFGSRVIEKRRRFKDMAFFLPHCWIVLELVKRKIGSNNTNIRDYKLDFNNEKSNNQQSKK